MWKTQVWTGLRVQVCVRACVHLRERLGAEVEMKPSSRGSSPRRTASTTRCCRSPPSSLSTPHTPGTQALTAHADRCCGTTFGPAHPRAFTHICGPAQNHGDTDRCLQDARRCPAPASRVCTLAHSVPYPGAFGAAAPRRDGSPSYTASQFLSNESPWSEDCESRVSTADSASTCRGPLGHSGAGDSGFP